MSASRRTGAWKSPSDPAPAGKKGSPLRRRNAKNKEGVGFRAGSFLFARGPAGTGRTLSLHRALTAFSRPRGERGTVVTRAAPRQRGRSGASTHPLEGLGQGSPRLIGTALAPNPLAAALLCREEGKGSGSGFEDRRDISPTFQTLPVRSARARRWPSRSRSTCEAHPEDVERRGLRGCRIGGSPSNQP